MISQICEVNCDHPDTPQHCFTVSLVVKIPILFVYRALPLPLCDAVYIPVTAETKYRFWVVAVHKSLSIQLHQVVMFQILKVPTLAPSGSIKQHWQTAVHATVCQFEKHKEGSWQIIPMQLQNIQKVSCANI